MLDRRARSGFTEEPFYQDEDPAIQSRPQGFVRPTGGLTMRRILAGPRRPAPASRRRRRMPTSASFASGATSRSRRTLARSHRDDRRAGPSTIAINHGIFRDFPTRYRGPHGGQVRVGFTFEGATLDGAASPGRDRRIANGVRIKIGDPDRIVEQSASTAYVIHYRTTRQIGRFKDYDELYWNATGNGWMFPIDVAEARIRLPEPVKFGQRAVYTGPQGSTASNAEVVDEKPGDIAFRTTQPLGPYEGLTVAVAFPKGVVAEPTEGSRPLAGWRTTARRWSASSACSACASFIMSRGSAPGAIRAPGRWFRSSRRPTTCRPPACATSPR